MVFIYIHLTLALVDISQEFLFFLIFFIKNYFNFIKKFLNQIELPNDFEV